MQHGLPEQAIEPTASRTGANKLGYRAVKRAFDLTVTAMAVIVLSPLFLILSVIVYLGDPGAVIYGQVRIGKNGKPFKMWKFRSMYRNADQMIDQLSEEQKRQYHTEFKIDNDPRITPVGNFLRKTSLDELPQLYDIFIGNMTIVGPRPERLETIELYEKEMPEFGMRLQVKAGLTGYAQVYGKANTSPYDKLQMDLMYIGEQSVITDLKIIFATIKILFMPESTEGFAEEKDALGTEKEEITV